METPLHAWVQQSFRPTVLVLSTPGVEAIAAKNNLTFAELLRPLGERLDNVGGMSCCPFSLSLSLSLSLSSLFSLPSLSPSLSLSLPLSLSPTLALSLIFLVFFVPFFFF